MHVFDVSQTSGRPLPERPAPLLLAGQAPTGLWDALADQVRARGFTVARGDCGAANGVTDYVARTVTVRAGDVTFDAVVRIDTPGEADYYRNGGIMQYVLRSLLKK